MKITESLDFYKLTMSQLAFERKPKVQVTFTMKNRGANRLIDHVDPAELVRRLSTIRFNGFDIKELEYLETLLDDSGEPLFTDAFLAHLYEMQLPPVSVSLDTTGEIQVETTGTWSDVTFWETIVMSELNELYSTNRPDLDFDEGYPRLAEKILRLRANPDIKIIDFGTRRRYSNEWHKAVVRHVRNRCPENLVGTSNVGFAKKFGLKPIGTFAHEMPMVYAALADKLGPNPFNGQSGPLLGHETMMNHWWQRYGYGLSTMLTDTFTTDYFFSKFNYLKAVAYKGLRQDSGDPFEFGWKAINHYKELGVTTQTKTIVFSDSLDIDKIERLYDTFHNHINVVFGWGTNLTNDFGVRPNNFVMKATAVDGVPTVKLSDDAGKHTGPFEQVERYKTLVKEAIDG